MNRSISRSWLGGLGAAVATLALAACGGGGGAAGQSGFGGGGAAAPAVADLVVALSSTTMANTAGSTVDLTVTAVDADRKAVREAPVRISTADRGAIIAPAGTATGDNGELRASLGIGNDRSNRLITVRVTSGAVTREADVLVVGARLSGTLQEAVRAPGESGSVRYRLEDHAGNPMPNTAIQIHAAGLTPATFSGLTRHDGTFLFEYTAGAAGFVHITAQAGGVSDTQVLEVRARGDIPAAVSTPRPTLHVTPIVVGRNAPGSTANRATLSARFLDGTRPVPNVRVRFEIYSDPYLVGGRISTGSTVLLSDAAGFVTAEYIAGEPLRGGVGSVTLRACYANDDNQVLADCTQWEPVALIVTGEPRSVSIGTNELIVVNEHTYVKRMLVTVVDSAGRPVSNVGISAVPELIAFNTGFYRWGTDRWIRDLDSATPPLPWCRNEDINRNDDIDPDEDLNGNGRLDPRRADVWVRVLQDRTRANGTVELEVEYLKEVATWVFVQITVVAADVSGTEGRVVYHFTPVPADSAAFRNSDVTPAFARSPYGTQSNCAARP